jgi:sec-independent protein translocase protein TatA
MFGIGLMELLTILVLATVVLGPERMVDFARQLGRWMAKFRAETDSVTKEFREAFNLELGTDLDEVRSILPGRAGAPRWNLPTSTAPAEPAQPVVGVPETTPVATIARCRNRSLNRSR